MNVQKRASRQAPISLAPPDESSSPEATTPSSAAFTTTASPSTPRRTRSESPPHLDRRPYKPPYGLSDFVTDIPHKRLVAAMMLLGTLTLYMILSAQSAEAFGGKITGHPTGSDKLRRLACPDYKEYSERRHGPYSKGQYKLPYQRPEPECRLFRSDAVEDTIAKITAKMADPDLARLFENTFPNTLDTTVRWHTDSDAPQTFIVTGDINAQWLRDSTNQLAQYQALAKQDPALRTLLLGAINTQTDFVLQYPYCNAFQPPAASGLDPSSNEQQDTVHPAYDNDVVFECKYEIDSLGSFLSLANQFHKNTGDTSFITPRWVAAVQAVLNVVEEQSVGTFGPTGQPNDMTYTFQRTTNMGSETLNLAGIGNPIASNTSLVRSAFRPSDDACILQFFIPGNAFLAVEMAETAKLLRSVNKNPTLAKKLEDKSQAITQAIYKYGTFKHPVYGEVFAFEVDGYGSHLFMDDANLPSLLSLPLMGFVKVTDPIYQNTRKMVTSRLGNPYMLVGTQFQGIGGPHIGIQHAWPLSLLVQAQTTDNDEEIVNAIEIVLAVSAELGLIHESVQVDHAKDYTRPWFAWANSVFAQTILDLAERKPDLLFGENAKINGKTRTSQAQDVAQDVVGTN